MGARLKVDLDQFVRRAQQGEKHPSTARAARQGVMAELHGLVPECPKRPIPSSEDKVAPLLEDENGLPRHFIIAETGIISAATATLFDATASAQRAAAADLAVQDLMDHRGDDAAGFSLSQMMLYPEVESGMRRRVFSRHVGRGDTACCTEVPSGAEPRCLLARGATSTDASANLRDNATVGDLVVARQHQGLGEDDRQHAIAFERQVDIIRGARGRTGRHDAKIPACGVIMTFPKPRWIR